MSPRYDAVPDAPQLPRRAGQAGTAPATPAEPLRTMSVAVPASLRQEFRVACVSDGVTVQEATAEALRAWLDRRKERQQPS